MTATILVYTEFFIINKYNLWSFEDGGTQFCSYPFIIPLDEGQKECARALTEKRDSEDEMACRWQVICRTDYDDPAKVIDYLSKLQNLVKEFSAKDRAQIEIKISYQ